jgi:hypothetical protein
MDSPTHKKNDGYQMAYTPLLVMTISAVFQRGNGEIENAETGDTPFYFNKGMIVDKCTGEKVSYLSPHQVLWTGAVKVHRR